MLGWYFFLWSMSGLHAIPFGPYYSQDICEERRLEIIRDVKNANHVSEKCSELPITLGGIK